MKTLSIVIAAIVVLAIAALTGIGRPEAAESASEEPHGGITVTGVGRVSTVPDEAEFSLGITTEGRTAAGALAANSMRMRELIEALKAAGVDYQVHVYEGANHAFNNDRSEARYNKEAADLAFDVRECRA